MLSDDWIRAGYRSGKRVALYENLVFYKEWYTKEDELVGVCIYFEYANDVAYDLPAESWYFFLKVWCGSKEATIESIRECFAKMKGDCYTFERCLRGRRFDVISF